MPGDTTLLLYDLSVVFLLSNSKPVLCIFFPRFLPVAAKGHVGVATDSVLAVLERHRRPVGTYVLRLTLVVLSFFFLYRESP